MIDFVSVNGNNIQLFDHNACMVGESANPEKLAEMVNIFGGLAPVVYRSSDWIEHPNCEEFDYVWYRVCNLV